MAKKRVIVWLLLFSLVISGLSGCFFIKRTQPEPGAEQKKEEVTPKPGTEQKEKETTPEPEAEQKKEETAPELTKVDAETAYQKILSSAFNLIMQDGEGEIKEGEKGLKAGVEGYLEVGDVALPEVFGYRIKDMTGDGIDELVIGDRTDMQVPYSGTNIYALYTLIDGTPKLLLQSVEGEDYYLAENGQIFENGGYNEGNPYFGLFKWSKDASQKEYSDFYFTRDKSDDVTGFYHNKVGVLEPKESEELDIDPEMLGVYMEELTAKVISAELLPFNAYDIENEKTYTVWGEFVSPEEWQDTEERFEADKTEPQTFLKLMPTRDIKNFKILSLSANLNEKTGDVTYEMQELYHQDGMASNRPFLVGLTFYGLYANYGFSYEEDGVVKRCTIEMSNKDGSLFFTKF